MVVTTFDPVTLETGGGRLKKLLPPLVIEFSVAKDSIIYLVPKY